MERSVWTGWFETDPAKAWKPTDIPQATQSANAALSLIQPGHDRRRIQRQIPEAHAG